MRIIRIVILIFAAAAVFALPAGPACAREAVLYNFEKDPEGWEIPDWVFGKRDNAGRQISVSEFHASKGRYSLEVDAEFTGGSSWASVYVERLIDVTDWSPFRFLSVDLYLPKDAPAGLRARIILTVGEEWKWIEMNRTVPLSPGEWTVVKAGLTPDSLQWRKFIDDSFRSDVRKLGVRIESNGRISYKGPIYIDNVRLSD